MSITIDYAESAPQWCVYVHLSTSGHLISLGTSKVRSVTGVKMPSEPFTLMILSTHMSEYLAIKAAAALSPAHAIAKPASAKVIACVDTGEVYPNASALAQVLNVHVSTVYAHLAGRYGYNTVKGRKFKC